MSFSIYYIVNQLIHFGICAISYYIYSLVMRIEINFNVRSELYLVLIREVLLSTYFGFIYFIFKSYGCLPILAFSIYSIISLTIQITKLKRTLPVILYIKESDNAELPNIKISHTMFVENHADIDEDALKTSMNKINPDGIVLHGVSVQNLKCVIKNRSNAKILIQNTNNQIRKLMLTDFFGCIGSITNDIPYDIGLLYNDYHLLSAFRNEFDSHSINTNQLTISTQVQNLDIVIITNLLTHPLPNEYAQILDFIKNNEHNNIPMILLAPIKHDSYSVQQAIHKYELMVQKYQNVYVLRVPYIAHEHQDFMKYADHHIWQHVSQISEYLIYIMHSISDNRENHIYHYVHGEELSGKHLLDINNFIQRLR